MRTGRCGTSGPNSAQAESDTALRIEQIIRRRVVIGEDRHVFGQLSVEVSHGDILNGIGK